MNTYDFILLGLKAMGEVRGKTMLQKRLYFIGLLSGYLSELDYVPHFYGPYSEELSNRVGELRSTGFINETSIKFGATDGNGFEVSRRDYTLTEEGQKIACLLQEKLPDEASKIEEAWQHIKQAGDLSYMQLSVAAKVYHILQNEENPLENEEISKLAHNLGWNISDPDVEKAGWFLEKLVLVSR